MTRPRCWTWTSDDLRQLVEDSGRELAAEIATDVLIIEDETFIALDLEGLVEGLGHRVLGVARTHKEAVALARAKRPGIILADIQLADGSSGLDAVNELLRSFEVPVIFITAYPERFLTGERPEPAFLIAKPFQPSMVSAVLSQALFFERNAHRRGELASIREPPMPDVIGDGTGVRNNRAPARPAGRGMPATITTKVPPWRMTGLRRKTRNWSGCKRNAGGCKRNSMHSRWT